jgi:hypothetical protein
MKSHIEEFLENPENKRLFNQEKLILDLEYKFSKKLKEFQKKSDSLFYLNLLYSPNSNKIINQNITFSDIPIRYISFSFIKSTEF